MNKVIKENILDYFKDHYKHFDGYPMEYATYDEKGNEETIYSFEECMELIRKELGKWINILANNAKNNLNLIKGF